MARHLRLEYPGAIYHVTVRGNARREVFLDDADREHFVGRLAESVAAYEVRLYLYCLMANHYHLLVETPKANLSRFMQSVETSHAVHFNLRHSSSGHLGQGRFGGKLVEGDEYLLSLCRYLHLNPVRTEAFKGRSVAERRENLRRYRWSSYRGYVGLAPEEPFIDYGPLQALAGGRGKRLQRRAFRAFVEAGLAKTEEQLREVLNESPRAMGSPGFLRWVDELYQGQMAKKGRREDVRFRQALLHVSPEVVLQTVSEELECGLEALRARKRGRIEKALAARMLWQYAGLTKRAVAEVLGLGSGAAVGWQLRKLDAELSGPVDRTLAQRVERLHERLNVLRQSAVAS